MTTHAQRIDSFMRAWRDYFDLGAFASGGDAQR